MGATKSQLRVALADDVPSTRKMMVRLHEQLGHNVICAASNGAELVDQCASRQIDVVFTDLYMPVMDGLAAAGELAVQGIPVILISGHPDAEQLVLEHEPVAAILSQPASMNMLQTAIDRVVADRSAG
jgi:CheY-like chemotaxis protein